MIEVLREEMRWLGYRGGTSPELRLIVKFSATDQGFLVVACHPVLSPNHDIVAKHHSIVVIAILG